MADSAASPAIRTDRLLCRPLVEELIEPLRRYERDNAAHLRPWEPVRAAYYFDDGPFQDRWRRQIADAERVARFLVVLPDAPDTVLAHISYTGIAPAPFLACHLGYSLAASAQGKGYMREALTATNRHMFQVRGLHRIMANYMPRNARSAATLKALGFEIEGHARSYLQIAGVWEDHVLTSLINEGQPS